MIDNTNIEALLPYPFCGSDDVHLQEPDQIEATSWVGYITCNDCDAQVSAQYTSDSILGAKIFAAATWNRRAALSNAEPVGEIMQVDEIVFCELHHPENMTIGDPVFLHPSVPAPLSDARIVEITKQLERDNMHYTLIDLARAVEQAHGIKRESE